MIKSDFDVNFQNSNQESKIVTALERISEAFRVLLWIESKENSLSPIQIQVLIFLLFHSEDKRKVSYLANEFNMTKATISDVVKSLEKKELIEKINEEFDSRSYRINLTQKGNKIAEKSSIFSMKINEPLNKLSTENKENLLLSLLEIIHHLNKNGIITIQRMCLNCQYYFKKKDENKHFCNLLSKELKNTDLRIDCPEHMVKKDNDK